MRRGIVVSINVLIAVLALSVVGLAQGPTSIPAPEGWSQCPRCQNNKDRDGSECEVQGGRPRIQSTRLVRRVGFQRCWRDFQECSTVDGMGKAEAEGNNERQERVGRIPAQ